MDIRETAETATAIGGAVALVIGWIKGAHRSAWAWVKARWSCWRTRARQRREVPGLVHEIAGREVRTTARFDAIDAAQAEQASVLAALQATLGSVQALGLAQFHRSRVAMFVCDNTGFNIDANDAYADIVGCNRDELLGFGYRTFLGQNSAEYLAGFAAAAAGHYVFQGEVALRDGKRLQVHMIPHPREKGPATHWVGTVKEIEPA